MKVWYPLPVRSSRPSVGVRFRRSKRINGASATQVVSTNHGRSASLVSIPHDVRSNPEKGSLCYWKALSSVNSDAGLALGRFEKEKVTVLDGNKMPQYLRILAEGCRNEDWACFNPRGVQVVTQERKDDLDLDSFGNWHPIETEGCARP